MPRGRIQRLGVSLGATALGLWAVACFTAPPPDLPAELTQRPAILHSSVDPPADQLLTELAGGEFVVPVQVAAGESFEYEVFLDYDPLGSPNANAANPRIPARTVQANAGLDGGETLVSFTLSEADFEPGVCPHRIEFFVAHHFNSPNLPAPESFGGDSVAWLYEPEGCLDYDAGDGAFPPADAQPDALPVAPESGADR